MIGNLRRRVTLLRPQRAPDGAGGFSISWDLAGEVWARVAPLNEGETQRADKLESPRRLSVQIRAPNAASAGWRLLWRGRAHQIESVSDGEAPGDPLTIVATEILP